MVDLSKLTTERRNPRTMELDTFSALEIATVMNSEDNNVVKGVEEVLPEIAQAITWAAEALAQGGRIIYIGAGTSGRLGLLDAVECPPTFGVSFEKVIGLLAGGERAFIKAVEGAEDNKALCVSDLKGINLTKDDVVIGIAASGRTPYVIGGLEYAKELGCVTGCIVTSPNSIIENMVDYPVVPVTGEEAITGSTRMKSGTAQKMVCNIISTTAMIKMGKVYENLMIDVMPTNEKLVARAHNIIATATKVTKEEAKELFDKYGTVKKAIFAVMSGIESKEEIEKYLDKAKGHIRNALKLVK